MPGIQFNVAEDSLEIGFALLDLLAGWKQVEAIYLLLIPGAEFAVDFIGDFGRGSGSDGFFLPDFL